MELALQFNDAQRAGKLSKISKSELQSLLKNWIESAPHGRL